jgi:hypothetical protein
MEKETVYYITLRAYGRNLTVSNRTLIAVTVPASVTQDFAENILLGGGDVTVRLYKGWTHTDPILEVLSTLSVSRWSVSSVLSGADGGG